LLISTLVFCGRLKILSKRIKKFQIEKKVISKEMTMLSSLQNHSKNLLEIIVTWGWYHKTFTIVRHFCPSILCTSEVSNISYGEETILFGELEAPLQI
jgi:hypothetical protein